MTTPFKNLLAGVYPDAAGFKSVGTSSDAATAVTDTAANLREQVLRVLINEPLTADECAQRLDQTPFAIRPRLSELRALGKIEDSKERRKNSSGHSAIVWQAAGTFRLQLT